MPVIPPEVSSALSAQLRIEGGKTVAAIVGVNRTTLYDALSAGRAGHQTLAKLESRLPKTPTNSDNK